MKKRTGRIAGAARRLLCVFLSLWLTAAPAQGVEVSAQAAVLLDARTGETLYEKNPDETMLIASTTKIMTALVALDCASPDETVAVRAECTRVEGSSMYLKAGERVTVEQLLYGLLLMSGNDAALALAYHCGGTVERFVALMNEKARKLGLADTSFENPHGLDGKNHHSTAADMAKLSAYAMENPEFYKIVSSGSYTMPGRSMSNHNRLLRMIPGAKGIKTGFTKEAGRCLVSCVERMGRRFIAVTLDAPSDWDDHRKLYELAFSGMEERAFLAPGEEAARVPVVGSPTASVTVACPDGLTVGLRPEEAAEAKLVLELPHFVYAPVGADTPAGRACVYVAGRAVAEAPLVFKTGAELPAEPESEGILKNLLKRLANIFGF